ncbi:MAG: acetyl-CoA carboxylase biotin carboxyl carrier protein [Bacteroidia bacterium]|nr:acetyl-CoA carboxylase biotin carboxyl carrier protein [Bacteroidia bacterium]
MNKKEIEELIKFVSKAGVSEVSIEQKDFKICIKNAQPSTVQTPAFAPAPVVMAPPPASVQAAVKEEPVKKEASGTIDESKLHVIKSPMIGTFYRASSPDKPNFVNVGDEIKAGKTLCIIEAMKLFNEIESDVAGKIVKVLVDNATPVEYDQPLFLVDPS